MSKLRKGSIYKKIQKQMLFGSAIATFVICAAAVICIFVMRDNVIKTSGNLGASAADDSKDALVVQMEETLLQLARNKASISDEKLSAVTKMVEIISKSATYVVSNPGKHLHNSVDYAEAANADKTVAQLRLPDGAVRSEYETDIGLLGNLSELLIAEHDSLDYVASVYLGSEKGISISADKDSDKKTRSFDPRTRMWYKMAFENGGLIWTDIFVDNLGRGLGITCAKPYFYENGEPAGVVGAGILLDVLKEIVVETRLGETGYAFIANEHGDMIISDTLSIDNDNNVVSHNISELLPDDVKSDMLSGKSDISLVEINGIDCFIAYAPLEVLPWSLAAVMSVEEVIAPATQSENQIINMTNEAVSVIDKRIYIALLLFLLIFSLVIAANMVFARKLALKLAAPIIKLNNGARIIGAGNLEHKLDVKTGDEIEALSDTFNAMIDNIKKITSEKERIGTELNIATTIQASMLPCIFPAFPERKEFDIYASMLPAKEVGGDFYDFFFIEENKLALVIADVSGKGVPAALFMVIAKTLIKNNAQLGKNPKEVFETVNNTLCENNGAGMFVTAFMGIWDMKTGVFSFVNAGHNPPLIKRSGGEFEWLRTKPGFVLAGIDAMEYKQHDITLEAGDVIYMYTDGVTESLNKDNELFSEERLLKKANAFETSSIYDFVDYIRSEIDIFADGAEQADDITMLILKAADNQGLKAKEITVEADVCNLQSVVAFVESEADSAGCPLKVRSQLLIAVEEIFVNIAHYAYVPESGSAVIRVYIDNGIVIEFEDTGRPFNPLEKDDPDISEPADSREVGGLGIYMVKEMMDGMEYHYKDGKNTLKIRKSLPQ